jgi:HEAT repeat protein
VPLAEGIRRLLARVDHIIVEQAFPEGEMRPTLILLVDRHAAGGLSEVGDDAVVTARQRLDRSLADPDPAVRRRAVERLGDLRDEWAFSRLMAGLEDANAEVREGAISALAPYGRKAIDPVVSLLRGEAYLAPRLAAVELLGQVGGPELVDLFKIMLNDPDPLVRRAAVEGLTQAGGRVAEEALGTATLDQDAGVREAALHGLKIYGRDPEHVLE